MQASEKDGDGEHLIYEVDDGAAELRKKAEEERAQQEALQADLEEARRKKEAEEAARQAEEARKADEAAKAEAAAAAKAKAEAQAPAAKMVIQEKAPAPAPAAPKGMSFMKMKQYLKTVCCVERCACGD